MLNWWNQNVRLFRDVFIEFLIFFLLFALFLPFSIFQPNFVHDFWYVTVVRKKWNKTGKQLKALKCDLFWNFAQRSHFVSQFHVFGRFWLLELWLLNGRKEGGISVKIYYRHNTFVGKLWFLFERKNLFLYCKLKVWKLGHVINLITATRKICRKRQHFDEKW